MEKKNENHDCVVLLSRVSTHVDWRHNKKGTTVKVQMFDTLQAARNCMYQQRLNDYGVRIPYDKIDVKLHECKTVKIWDKYEDLWQIQMAPRNSFATTVYTAERKL